MPVTVGTGNGCEPLLKPPKVLIVENGGLEGFVRSMSLVSRKERPEAWPLLIARYSPEKVNLVSVSTVKAMRRSCRAAKPLCRELSMSETKNPLSATGIDHQTENAPARFLLDQVTLPRRPDRWMRRSTPARAGREPQLRPSDGGPSVVSSCSAPRFGVHSNASGQRRRVKSRTTGATESTEKSDS